MRTPLVLGLALLSLPAAAEKPLEFLDAGAGSVALDGVVEVPLLRGVDTKGRPAVLATGPDKGDDDPDEFLLTIALSEGPNKCTEAVVGTLGGWTQQKTVARQGSFLGSVTKTATEIAYIPEMRIGELTLRDVHCEVDKTTNALAMPQLIDLAVAVMPSEGVVRFAGSDDAAKLLDAVGNTHAAVIGEPGPSWNHGRKVVTLGRTMLATVSLFGKPATVALDLDSPNSMVASGFEGIPWTVQRSGLLYTAGGAEIGGQALPVADYTVYDGTIAEVRGPSETIPVDAVLGLDTLYAVDVAIDYGQGKIALAPADTVKWTDPSDTFLEEDREKFEKAAAAGSASLLQPLPEVAKLAGLDFTDDTCVAHLVVDAPNKANANGVRTFGASKVTLKEVPCDTGLVPLTQDDDAAADGGGESDDGDSKEATRQADWGDALWKRGRYADAYAAYETALENAGDDCTFALDFAVKSFSMGQVDAALSAAGTAGRLYDKWASQPLSERLDGEGEQDDSCHTAFGLEAAALLARGSYSKVEGVFDDHMDLDEDLAQVTALSRLANGRADKAHGVLLQALNVGGRGDPTIHVTLGLTGARMNRDRIAEASLDRLFSLEDDWTLEDALAAVAVARDVGGDARVKQFTERLVKERPASAVAWAVHGLEAHRRGDAAAVAQVAEKTDLAQASIDRGWGSSTSLANAAALRAVAGDSAGAARDLELAGNAPKATASVLAARSVAAAMTGDSTALDTQLQAMARRAPMHPLGTLKLLAALPGKADAPE